MRRVFEGYLPDRWPLSEYDSPTLIGMLRASKMPAWPNKVRITVEDLPESKPEPINPCPFIGKCSNENQSNCRCCNDDGHWYLYRGKEPEKNCGNCVNMGKLILPNRNGKGPCHIPEPPFGYCTAYQPKAAEPQSWEQRVCSNCNYKSACASDKIHMTCTTIDAIRAEIEAAWGRGFKAGHDVAKENQEE